jgi:hypothetical protein
MRLDDDWTGSLEGIVKRFMWMLTIALVALVGAAVAIGRSDSPRASTAPTHQTR